MLKAFEACVGGADLKPSLSRESSTGWMVITYRKMG